MVRVMLVPALVLAANMMQGAAAPTYDVAFALAEGTYTGTTTFNVDAKGEVSGAMKLTTPIVVNAALAGAVKGGTWTFEYGYTIPEQGCSGTVKGTGKVSSDKKKVEGDVTIAGACVEAPMAASFTFIQQAKK
jgi:hypothetical protein